MIKSEPIVIQGDANLRGQPVVPDTPLEPHIRKVVEAREKVNAAVHQAGHFVMATYLGMCVDNAKIWRVGEATLFTLSWNGHTQALAYRASKKGGFTRRIIAREKYAQYAVAGAVATECWHREEFDEDVWYDADVMSARLG